MKDLDKELEAIDAGDELEPIDAPEQNQQASQDNNQPEAGEDTDNTNAPVVGQRAARTSGQELSAEKIAELSASITEKMLARQQANAPRQQERLSPEQIEKLLNPVKITKDFLARHGLIKADDDENTVAAKIKFHQELSDMQTKHHTSLMQVALESLQRKMVSQAEPMFDYYQRAQQERDKQEFFKDYPKLAKFGKFVQFAASTIKPTNADGSEKTVVQVKREIAQATKDLLKESGVDLDAVETNEDETDTNHSAVTTQRSDVPRMARMQGSGRSGGPQAKGASNNPDADIYS